MVLGRQGPAGGCAACEPTPFERAKRMAEAGVVDAKPFAEGGLGAGGRGAAEFIAHGVGEWKRIGLGADELESARFAVAAGEAEEQGLRCGCGAVLDGETKLLVTTDEIASRVGPVMVSPALCGVRWQLAIDVAASACVDST